MIDKNNPDYQTPLQEEIWNAATDLVPLEVSLPMIPKEYHEACTELHHFFTDLLNDMYGDPDPYMAVSDLQTYIRWFWIELYKKWEFSPESFMTSQDNYAKFRKKGRAPLIDFLVSRWDFRVETQGDTVQLKNTRYPHMLTAVYETLKAAYKNYNVNCGDFLTFCDFRALVNYKRTYQDMLVLLNDQGREIAEQIIAYGSNLGIKPVKCTYFKRVEFKRKSKIVFILDVIKGKNLKINIGFAEIGGQAFDLIAKVVDQYEDKEDFAHFWRSNLKKCTNCDPNCLKKANPIEVFGLKTIVCQAYLRMFSPKDEELAYIFRLIQLRTMVVEAGVSEPFYPGNG